MCVGGGYVQVCVCVCGGVCTCVWGGGMYKCVCVCVGGYVHVQWKYPKHSDLITRYMYMYAIGSKKTGSSYFICRSNSWCKRTETQ